MDSNLPEGWKQTKLKELVSYRKGKKPKVLSSEKFKNAVPYLNIKAIEKNIVDEYADADSSNITNGDEIFIVWDGARSGWVAKGMKGAIGSTLMAIKPYLINADYLFRFLQTQFDYINSNPRGTGIPHVDPEIFWELQVPLAPLPEQQRIVEKLDSLMARIASSKARLERIPAILKNFRQSVLASAVSGELTKNEFKNNHWQDLLGKDVFEFITSGSRGWAQYYSEVGQLFIRVTNLDYDTIKINVSDEKNKYVSPPLTAEGIRTKVVPNDILISITGDVGMVGLVEDNIGTAYVNQHVCLARPRNEFYPLFIAYFISAVNGGRKYFNDVKKGATKAGLGLDDIKNLPFSIPSIKEQKEIVRKVEELFQFADSIEARYQKAKAWFDKLPQSLLAKAFRGELVPQNEADEPAAELLKRIQAEKAGSASKSPRAAKGKKAYTINRDEKLSMAAEE